MRKTLGRMAVTAGAFTVAGVAATVLKNNLSEHRRSQREDIQPFGSVRGDQRALVREDGLAINLDIDDGPEPTVIFVHGWMCDSDAWHFQRLALRGQALLVFMDLRSHGRSGRALAVPSKIDDLADDLAGVIEDVSPTGPVVLVGHSMGGMTIMRLAGRHPRLFRDTVVGAVLVSTTAGGGARPSSGMRGVGSAIRAFSPLLDWGREFNSYSVIKRWGVGPRASLTAIDLTNEMVLRAPSQVIVDFYPLIADLDLSDDLAAFNDVRVSIVCGTRDSMTPFSLSRRLAAEITGSELVPVNDAGHMVLFEEPEQVTEAIERVLRDVS